MTPTELKKYLTNYQNRKRKWTFPAKSRRLFYEFQDLEFNKAIQHLNEKFEVFDFIYDKLKIPEEKIELKSDFQEHLELLKSKQKIKKFAVLIDGYIQKLDKPENKNRAGRKKVEQKNAVEYLLVSDNDKQVFLDKLKAGFKDATKKEFCYFLVGLNQLKYLKVEEGEEKNIFNSFSSYLGGEYGGYPNFNKHWNTHNDKKLLDSTKDRITAIKINNVIM